MGHVCNLKTALCSNYGHFGGNTLPLLSKNALMLFFGTPSLIGLTWLWPLGRSRQPFPWVRGCLARWQTTTNKELANPRATLVLASDALVVLIYWVSQKKVLIENNHNRNWALWLKNVVFKSSYNSNIDILWQLQPLTANYLAMIIVTSATIYT